MKTNTPIAILLLALASGTAAHADHPWRHNHVGFSLHAGSFELEGPAVPAQPDEDDEDVDMFGLRAEGHLLVGNAWYTRGVADFSRLDGEAGLVQANVSFGTIRALKTWERWSLDGYVQAGVEYMRSSDLDRLATDPEFDGTSSGSSGDDVGATVEIGLSLGFRSDSRVDIYAKYLNLGDEAASFGIRASHDLNEKWTVIGGLDAVWVENPGTRIDVDFHRFNLGLLRKF
ncbi:hypothetical protein ASA1KI_00380 [Opitutales bacterium ASA1]|uniref:hypothetical protein n=1 Tax=Congregicoccus parvus TaxID=3081749 RepID=UPI002B2ABA70|nr:hypothetical protein ASA1KI_00380 [Opitutales bacterium ASA1]